MSEQRGQGNAGVVTRSLAAAVDAIAVVIVTVGLYLGPFGLLWAAISPIRRSWQDILVGTVVVYDRYRDGGERATMPERVEGEAAGQLPP